jgi:hypothetical protein
VFKLRNRAWHEHTAVSPSALHNLAAPVAWSVEGKPQAMSPSHTLGSSRYIDLTWQ